MIYLLKTFQKRSLIKLLVLVFITYLVLNFFGVFDHPFEIDYRNFKYPLEGDVLKYAEQLRHNQTTDKLPINNYNFKFKWNPSHVCRSGNDFAEIKLLFVVKSATGNFKNREAIRNSWGFERRFSDVDIKTVFVLGNSKRHDIQKLIDVEAQNYEDVVQADFDDTYYNNTIKTMMGFRWAVENCPKSSFYTFVDDDYYVSAKNLLRFVKDPINYPDYIQETDDIIKRLSQNIDNKEKFNEIAFKEIINSRNVVHSIDTKKHLEFIKNSIEAQKMVASQNKNVDKTLTHEDADNINVNLFDRELSQHVKLYSGFVMHSAPHRHKLSKWVISVDEYPYSMWPPYVTAGAVVLSREALMTMYYVSKFTKHFR